MLHISLVDFRLSDAAIALEPNFSIPQGPNSAETESRQKLDSSLQCHSITCHSTVVTKGKYSICTTVHHRMLPRPAYLDSFSYGLPRFLNAGEQFEKLLHVLPDVCNTVWQIRSAALRVFSSHPMDWVTASGNAKELKILEYIKAGYESNLELLSTCPKVLYMLDFCF